MNKKFMLGCRLYVVSRMAHKCILGSSVPLPLKDAHSREATFAVMRGWRVR